MTILPILTLLLLGIGSGFCWIEEDALPPSLKACLQMKTSKQTVLDLPSESVCNTCLSRYMWMEGPTMNNCKPYKSNATMEEITNFVAKALCDDLKPKGRRKKRQAVRCQRKEYRTLSDGELKRLHEAWNRAYVSGHFHWVARFHNDQIQTTAHGGPGFFAYHRMMILILERILQYYDDSVCLPYWDSSLDANMDSPQNSHIWSAKYFGSSNGVVRTGDFRHFRDINGNRITRNAFHGGQLFTAQRIRQILSLPTIYRLSEPSQFPTLETYHDDVHNVIGGTMSPLTLASSEVIFWLHHCFVDYLWEYWRFMHGYNTVYPNTNVRGQGPNDVMIHMPYMRIFGRRPTNQDGYSRTLAQQAYYSLSPTCTAQNPNCGPNLQCRLDRGYGVCCGIDMYAQRQTRPFRQSRGHRRVTITRRHRGRRRDRRRGKRDTDSDYSFTIDSKNIDNVYIPKEKEPCLGKPIQNYFAADDCTSNVIKYGFIAVKIVRFRPNEAKFQSTAMDNAPYDIYDEHKYKSLNYYVHPGNPATYEQCDEDESGAFRVRIKAAGTSYPGQYVDYVFGDNRLPVSSNIGYVGIEKPTSSKPTTAFVYASDACGRLCKPTCARRHGNNVYYEPCSGAIKVTTQTPLMYGNNFGEAVLSVWDFHNNQTPQETQSNIFMIFYCDYSNSWPWPECNKNKG